VRAWAFAARSLVRQPGRSGLGILGVAAVGALLFDMLLLSRGLVVSLERILATAGFDVRVIATDSPFLYGPRITNAAAATAAIAALPEVEEVVPLRFGETTAAGPGGRELKVYFLGAEPGSRSPWTLVAGRDLPATEEPWLVVNPNFARTFGVSPGGRATLRGGCTREGEALPPLTFGVAGIVEFPFDENAALTAATRLAGFRGLCGQHRADEADLFLVAAHERHGPVAAVKAIRGLRPDLHAFSNEEMVERFQQVGFSYFRQISTVLSSVTLFFGFLLITVLLTVSVNQRFAEIATLRALGFSRRRVVVDVLCQSVLLVGAGGVLSLPLGLLLATWLDTILRALPEIPASLHFFVFHGRALWLQGGLLGLTALAAALYPMRLVARLPIAATLRDEVVG
jgi:ABC-type lipoprotein release transport system permease subunit